MNTENLYRINRDQIARLAERVGAYTQALVDGLMRIAVEFPGITITTGVLQQAHVEVIQFRIETGQSYRRRIDSWDWYDIRQRLRSLPLMTVELAGLEEHQDPLTLARPLVVPYDGATVLQAVVVSAEDIAELDRDLRAIERLVS